MTNQERAAKKDLEKRMFASRVELSDELKPPKTETVTTDDILKFLRLSGQSHKKLFHYTKLGSLEGLLRSRKLYLSRLSEMNDLLEYTNTPNADRTYIACFSYGSCENMEMWRMYGGSPRESIRLEFQGRDVFNAIGEMKGHDIYKVSGDNVCTNDKIELNDVEEWRLHDVAYKYGDALYWNNNVIGIGRCRALQDVSRIKELATYVKNFGWMSENEVRLTIKLRTSIPGLRRIAVDFGAPIDNMSVLAGPEGSKEFSIRRMVRDCSFNGNIALSEYKVDFTYNEA